MKGDRRLRGGQKMPTELEGIHDALGQIEIEERGSYAAELKAELTGAWRDARQGTGRRVKPTMRYAAASAAAIVVIGTLAVPPARASLVRLIWPQPQQAELPVEPSPEPEPAAVPAAAVSTEPGHSKPSPASYPPDPELADFPDFPAPLPTTFPILLDRERARAIVADEYPDSLQQAGVGGEVQVLMWVRPDGVVDYTQIGKTSGLPDLDVAALRATRTLRFLPATRAGKAVGTWVEFSIEFRPFADQPVSDQEDHGIQIPLSN